MYTGSAATDADQYADNVFPRPAMDPGAAAAARSSLVNRNADIAAYLASVKAGASAATVLGEVFSLLGFTLGSEVASGADLYLDSAFYTPSVRATACAAAAAFRDRVSCSGLTAAWRPRSVSDRDLAWTPCLPCTACHWRGACHA